MSTKININSFKIIMLCLFLASNAPSYSYLESIPFNSIITAIQESKTPSNYTEIAQECVEKKKVPTVWKDAVKTAWKGCKITCSSYAHNAENNTENLLIHVKFNKITDHFYITRDLTNNDLIIYGPITGSYYTDSELKKQFECLMHELPYCTPQPDAFLRR